MPRESWGNHPEEHHPFAETGYVAKIVYNGIALIELDKHLVTAGQS